MAGYSPPPPTKRLSLASSCSSGGVMEVVCPSGKYTWYDCPRGRGAPVPPEPWPRLMNVDLWVIQKCVLSLSGIGIFQFIPTRHFMTPPTTSAPLGVPSASH